MPSRPVRFSALSHSRRAGLAALAAVALASGAGTIVGAPVAIGSDRLDMYEVFRQPSRPAPAVQRAPGLVESLFGGVSRRAPEMVEPVRPMPVALPPGEGGEGPFRTLSGPDIPVLMQTPVASVFEDSTLRPGDMVVTERGIEVFRGRPGRSRHDRDDFVAVDMKRLPKSERAMLAQIDSQVKGTYRSAARQPARPRGTAEAGSFTVRSVKPRLIPGVAAVAASED